MLSPTGVLVSTPKLQKEGLSSPVRRVNGFGKETCVHTQDEETLIYSNLLQSYIKRQLFLDTECIYIERGCIKLNVITVSKKSISLNYLSTPQTEKNEPYSFSFLISSLLLSQFHFIPVNNIMKQTLF